LCLPVHLYFCYFSFPFLKIPIDTLSSSSNYSECFTRQQEDILKIVQYQKNMKNVLKDKL
jgi:hypothetical protein